MTTIETLQVGNLTMRLLEQKEVSCPSAHLVRTGVWATPQGGRASSAMMLEKNKAQSCYFSTWINITKGFVGAASFELPYAFKQGGVGGTIVGVITLAVLSSFSLQLYGRCSELCPRSQHAPCTVYLLGRQAFGSVGAFVAWFGLVAMTRACVWDRPEGPRTRAATKASAPRSP